MDAITLATAVVQMISTVVSGVVTRVGDHAIEDVARRTYGLVRERLGNSDIGRLTLSKFEEQPAERTRQELLRSVLAEEINADPAFAEQLRKAASIYIATQSGSVEGSQYNTNLGGIRGRNQISIGPMTITNTRQARISLATVGVVLLLLLGFGTYGAVNIFTGDEDSEYSPRLANPEINGNVGNQPGEEGAGTTGKTTREKIDLEGLDPFKDRFETHLEVNVQFKGTIPLSDSCQFSPPAGTTILPLTLTVLNRNPDTSELYVKPTIKIKSLSSATLYDAEGVVCDPIYEEGNLPMYSLPGPQQQKDYPFLLVGAPEDALSSTGVQLTFTVPNPNVEKVMKATVH